jgi:hypothetical protein
MIKLVQMIVVCASLCFSSVAQADVFDVWHQDIQHPEKVFYKGQAYAETWSDVRQFTKLMYPVPKGSENKLRIMIKLRLTTKTWI